MKLTKNEKWILYTLLNDHLNTISDISAHYLDGGPVASDPGDYLWELEKLETKLEKEL